MCGFAAKAESFPGPTRRRLTVGAPRMRRQGEGCGEAGEQGEARCCWGRAGKGAPNWEFTLTGELPPIPGRSSFHTGFQKRALCVAPHALRYLQLLVPQHHPPLSVHLARAVHTLAQDEPFGDSPSSIQPGQLSLRQVCSARLQVFLAATQADSGESSSEAEATLQTRPRHRAPCRDSVAEGLGARAAAY